MKTTDLLRLNKAAELMEVNTETIRRWANAGKIEVVRTDGGHRMVPVSEIIKINSFRLPHKKLEVED